MSSQEPRKQQKRVAYWCSASNYLQLSPVFRRQVSFFLHLIWLATCNSLRGALAPPIQVPPPQQRQEKQQHSVLCWLKYERPFPGRQVFSHLRRPVTAGSVTVGREWSLLWRVTLRHLCWCVCDHTTGHTYPQPQRTGKNHTKPQNQWGENCHVRSVIKKKKKGDWLKSHEGTFFLIVWEHDIETVPLLLCCR